MKILSEATNVKETVRIDSLSKGSVFGELYMIFDVPSEVIIKTEERTKVIKIPKVVFDTYIKDYYIENMEK